MQARRGEAERTIEEMLSADGYGVYAEVRRVGTLARSEDLKTAVGMLGLVGTDETQPLSDLFNFVSENAEALAEARAVLAFLPTRPGLPQALVALELPTPESAAAFEPKFRRVVGQQYETVENALAGQPAPRTQGTLKPASKDANDKAATGETGDKGAAAETTEKGTLGQKGATSEKSAASEKGATGAASEKASARESAQKSSGAQGFSVRRFGRLLVAGESPFTLRRLRGEEGGPSLSENARFQSVRARFASDSIFVYVDTTLAQQGYAVEQQRQQEALAAQAAGDKQTTTQYDVRVRKAEEPTAANSSTAATAANSSPSSSPTPEATPALTGTTAQTPTTTGTPVTNATPTTNAPVIVGQVASQTSPAPQPSATTQTEVVTSAQPVPSPEQPTDEESAETQANARAVPSDAKVVVSRADSGNAAKPSEEQVSVQRMGGMLRGLWDGAPRIPGAVAVGLSLDSGSLALRVAVENTPDGVVSLIPFLPNLIAGPPVAADAAQVAPADSDIFLATSLDWTQIYNAALGSASLNPERLVASWETSDEGEDVVSKPGERVPTPEEVIATVEKLFGFSFREDLLPALGNEVAVCVPLSEIIGSPSPRRGGEKKEGKDAEPGFVVIVSLNNPDKIREILPRVFAALGFVPLGAPQPPPEKRQGFEIRSLGGPAGLSYAVVDNFLVLAEQVEHVRYVLDAYAARSTLAAQQSYRDSTEWQARQKLGEIYVSESLMRSTAESTKRDSGGSADPVVRMLLPQLDAEPRPASYQVTNEGDVLVHELRLPLSLIRVYAVSALISARDAPVVGGERMAVYALNRIAEVEQMFKDEKKKGRYGTLDELAAEKLLEQDFIARLGYKIELNAAGDHFEANATPKAYGKTGRRSFFINEEGAVRGADHKGERATADDPPVN